MNNFEAIRLAVIGVAAPLLAFFAPIESLFFAWVIAFAFNIICGLHADGCGITTCRSFSMRKFNDAVVQFALFVMVTLVFFSTVRHMATIEIAKGVTVALSWIFVYFNLVNGVKNLRKANPRSTVILTIYYIVRLELGRAMPTNVRTVIERVNNEIEKQNEKN